MQVAFVGIFKGVGREISQPKQIKISSEESAMRCKTHL